MSDKQDNRLLLRGGQVFDSAERRFLRQDVRIAGGKVAALAPSLTPGPEERVVEARGRLVLPALIDFHLHCFRQGQALSVDAEEVAAGSGTTTFVDAGSAGSMNFQAFREHVIEPAAVRILAFLNISAIGMVSVGASTIPVGENDDDRLLDVSSAVEVIEKNRDLIVGVKVRMYTGLASSAALRRGREVAERVGLPMMVHIASGPPVVEAILPGLRAGDVVTHIYHGGADALVDEHGRVREVFREARARGIEFDVGLDRMHTDFTVARQGIAEGFVPDYLGTDMTRPNRHVTIDLPATVSKFVALGLPLDAALAAATLAPARKLGLDPRAGCLCVGSDADIGVFEWEEGAIEYADSYGNRATAQGRLKHWQTLRRGVALQPPARKMVAYEFLMK